MKLKERAVLTTEEKGEDVAWHGERDQREVSNELEAFNHAPENLQG